jgi:hypothetical protein
MTVRAARLGWHWSDEHESFIRMSTPSHGENVVELCPHDAVPTTGAKGDHRAWWENPEILQLLPWLRGFRRAKKHIRVACNDDGEIVA